MYGGRGVYHADDLTRADQVIPDSLVKGLIPGRGCNAIRLDIKSWFSDTELGTSDSILGLLSHLCSLN